jgi:AbrB family looped-hinge helix DNA binding protein
MAVSDDATVTSKGQVTIPKRIREELGLEAGTEVEFILDDDGSLRVRPKEPPMERLRAIHDFDGIESMPLVDEIAEYAADLRAEYYDPGERELSYADAIHLATAVVHDDCDVLYSGDPDFEGIDAIETVVL